MSQHGSQSGFIDELIDLLVSQPFRTEEGDIGEFLHDESINPFDLDAFLASTKGSSIPSEGSPQVPFVDRLPKESPFSVPQFLANEQTLAMGNEIVLNSLLQQMDLPSASAGVSRGKHVFPDIDIGEFFGDSGLISKDDLFLGSEQDSIDLLIGRDI